MKYTILALLFSTTAIAQENKEIKILVSNTGMFDIIFHRAKSTATGAILFGVIGATVQEGHLKSKDTKMKKQVLETLSDSSCSKNFINKLIEKLGKNSFNAYLADNKKDKSKELFLNIKIKKCGFKMVNSTTNYIAAFIDFNVFLLEDKKRVFEKKFAIKSKHQYSFADLISDKQRIDDEMTSVLNRAGTRLANKIIYL